MADLIEYLYYTDVPYKEIRDPEILRIMDAFIKQIYSDGIAEKIMEFDTNRYYNIHRWVFDDGSISLTIRENFPDDLGKQITASYARSTLSENTE